MEEESKIKGISMNSLINSIFKKYLIWNSFIESMGMIPITKKTLKKLFQRMNEEEIKKISVEIGGNVPQELVYLSYNKSDFNNIMEMIKISNSRFGIVKYTLNDSICNINILHGMCLNFSKFLKDTHQNLAQNLSLKMTIQHMDNNMICLEFEKPEINE